MIDLAIKNRITKRTLIRYDGQERNFHGELIELTNLVYIGGDAYEIKTQYTDILDTPYILRVYELQRITHDTNPEPE